jgi:F-type H+-transporting ATPase subunit delta
MAAQDFEKGIDVADVYAAALFALAREAGTVEAVGQELAELARLTEQNATFAAFTASVAIDTGHRAASLERMFRGRLSDMVLNTLLVMNRHGRVGLLHALRRAYELRMEEARGQVEVLVTSAVALDPAQRSEVTRLAAALSGKQPVIECRVDPAILGGLILQIGDHRLDNSVRRHLLVARQRLWERTARAEAHG